MSSVVDSHDTKRKRIRKRFHGTGQYKSYGPLLVSLEIHGFRGVADLALKIESFITALSGLNGTGKRTIAQLACCGYRKAPEDTGRHYVQDYFPVSLLDP